MTAQELLGELTRLGIRLEVRGDRLAFYPISAVPAELVASLKANKLELLVLIGNSIAPAIDVTDAVAVWSAALDRLATEPDWPPDLIAALRAAVPQWNENCAPSADETSSSCSPDPRGYEDNEEIEWPPPCPKCGSLEQWESIGGVWRCQHCEPPTVSRRFRAAAERIRRRTTQLRRDAPAASGMAWKT